MPGGGYQTPGWDILNNDYHQYMGEGDDYAQQVANQQMMREAMGQGVVTGSAGVEVWVDANGQIVPKGTPGASFQGVRQAPGSRTGNTGPMPLGGNINQNTAGGVYDIVTGRVTPMTRYQAEQNGMLDRWAPANQQQQLGQFSAGPGGAGAGTGTGATTTGATTTGATAGGAQAMTWGDAAGLALGAWQAYEGYQGAKDSGGPWTQGITPGFGLGNHLQTIGNDAMALYQQQQGAAGQMPDFYRGGGGGGGGRGGGGGGGGAPAGPQGMDYMQQLMGQAMGMQGGSAALQAGQGMLADRLGSGSFNPYAGQVQDAAMGFNNPYQNSTFNAAQGMQQGGSNPYVDRFLGSLGLGIGNAEAAGSGGGSSDPGRGTRGGGGGGQRSGGFRPVKAEDSGNGYNPNLFNPYLKAVLDGKFMEGNPHLEEMIATMAADTRAKYENGVIPGAGDQFERAGMLNSSVYGDALARADASFSEELSQQELQARYQGYETGVGTYMDALGLGNQLQLGKMNNDTQLAAANASASASAGAAAASLEAQQRMHSQQMALGALNLYSDDQQFGLGQMGNMAGMFGDQQLGALGIAGQMALGRGEQDLGALGLLPGMEQANWMGTMNAWDMATGMQGMQNQQAQQSAAQRAQQAQRDQQRWMFNQQNPWNNLSNVTGIVGGIASDFGTRYGSGGGPAVNPAGAAVAGFASGMGTGQGLYDMFGGGGG